MRVGILVLFYNNEEEIVKYELLNLIKTKSNIVICLVNNGSKDKTLDILKTINLNSKEHVSVLDIKMNKGPNAAVKAGARYLVNNENVNCIVHMKYNMLSHFRTLKKQIKTNLTVEFLKESRRNKVFKNIFSINQILDIK